MEDQDDPTPQLGAEGGELHGRALADNEDLFCATVSRDRAWSLQACAAAQGEERFGA